MFCCPDTGGAFGFWAALGEVFGREAAAVLVSRAGNVLAALPKSAHPVAKKALVKV